MSFSVTGKGLAWGCILLFATFFILVPFASAATSPVINEYLPHPSSGNTEWIEIYNPDHVSLADYFLDDDLSFSDDAGSSPKKSLATIVQEPSGAMAVFETSSFLNNGGDTVALFDGTGNIVDSTSFDKDPGVDVSIGRYPDGSGDFAVLSSSTKGSANTGPFIPTSTPTLTPKPTPTLKPLPTAKPTPTVKPTHTPTVTPILRTSTIQVAATEISPTKNAFVLADEDSDNASVSGATESALLLSPTPRSPSGSPTILTKGVKRRISGGVFGVILIVIAGICLIGCGILVFLRQRGFL